MMKVKEELLKKLKNEKLHFSLFDPEKLIPDKASKLAKKVEEYGTDAIMVGGSTTTSVDEVTKAIKESVEIPVILFPSSAQGVSKYADAIFFMSLLNSTKYAYLAGEQIKGAPLVKEYGLEPIGMGYIVINTGTPTAVEKVTRVKRLTTKEIVNCALAAQYFGMTFVYLEAGSGAGKSVSDEIIEKVKRNVRIPVIVGGGINGPITAVKKLKAGADIIVTGTVIEKAYPKVAEIIASVKKFKITEQSFKLRSP